MDSIYLCKAKSIDSEKWVQGYYIKRIKKIPACGRIDDDIEHLIVYNSFSDWDMPRHLISIKINPATLCRCTGLRDENKKLIWEKDIAVNTKTDEICEILWDTDTASFIIKNADVIYSFDNLWSNELEIISNEIDNPELLENDIRKEN